MSRHVVLNQTEVAFVEGLAATGRSDSSAEAVAEALRLLRERKARLPALRDARAEGCGSEGRQSAETIFDGLAKRCGTNARAPD